MFLCFVCFLRVLAQAGPELMILLSHLSFLFIKDEKEHGKSLSFLPLPHFLTALVFSELQLRLDSVGAKLGLSRCCSLWGKNPVDPP